MVSVFGAWGPDVQPFCLPHDVGVRVGRGGYSKLMIQVISHFSFTADLESDITL